MPQFHSKFFDAYDDDAVLIEYIKLHLGRCISDVEGLALTVASFNETRDRLDKASTEAANELMARIVKRHPEVLDVASVGTQALWNNIRRKVLIAEQQGEISINRCPSCSCIVRTPSARQCLWCKHDWHNVK